MIYYINVFGYIRNDDGWKLYDDLHNSSDDGKFLDYDSGRDLYEGQITSGFPYQV